jgi:hypothetical protein
MCPCMVMGLDAKTDLTGKELAETGAPVTMKTAPQAKTIAYETVP